MRRVGIFLLAVIALVAMVGPASAQPKVTITGFVDNMTTWTHNVSTVDGNVARNGDNEWYARTRVRPDITAEVGTTKFVLGLEIDATWGQTAAQDTSVCLNAACANAPQRFGTTGGWDLNTDLQGTIEMKWAYTEFDVPLIPVPTRMRIGAQPWEATYKLAVLANGDFAGAHVTSQILPMLKLNFTYAQIEEQSTGVRDGFPRGDDWAIITSVEITPFKGLDIRPIFSYANFIGQTNGAARQARGGIGTGGAVFPTGPASAAANANGAGGVGAGSASEDRLTVGVDARWRFGPFSLDPTIMYQFGGRDMVCPAAAVATCSPGSMTGHKIDAWFFDIRGGWQAGPLLLEGAAIYVSGNKAKDRLDLAQSRIKYYQPISTDTSYYGGWAELWALGLDYFSAMRESASAVFPGVAIGYDKYGLIRAGLRASYALTPAFSLRAAANANWTAQDVDTSSSFIAATGLTPCAGLAGAAAANCSAQVASQNGTARFLGTEINLGFQWRFAPNVALDVVGAYAWNGNAMSNICVGGAPGTAACVDGRNPSDTASAVARIRYSW